MTPPWVADGAVADFQTIGYTIGIVAFSGVNSATPIQVEDGAGEPVTQVAFGARPHRKFLQFCWLTEQLLI